MPSNELKQRKKNTSQKQNDDSGDGAKQNGEVETKKSEQEQKSSAQNKSSPCFTELRNVLSLLCVSVCVALTWVVLQQNKRFAEVEEKYNLLHGRAASYAELEQRVEKVSEKLEASKNRLERALSSVSTAARLVSDVASLRSVVTAMQASEEGGTTTSSSSGGIQEVNARFLNVTEAWQTGLAAVTTDLAALREESRASHVRATENINTAERRLRAITERVEELEDSTWRNARAFERTEEEDAKQTQRQLDWNTARVSELDERLARLARADQEFADRLDEHVPRAQQCQEHLPAVEEAVRSILRLTTGFASVERRVEELGLQVLGLEDSMLKGLTQTLAIRQDLDTLRDGRQERTAGSEIDAMLETLREMEMESKRMGEEEAEGRNEADGGIIMIEQMPLEEPGNKDIQEEELPVPEEVLESFMSVETQLKDEEELPQPSTQ